MILVAATLLSVAQADPHVISLERVETGSEIAGGDYLLVAEAARHPAMRDADLRCYRIVVSRQGGRRTVAFLGPPRMSETTTAEGLTIEYRPPDPACRTIGFEMDDEGRVGRVIRSRH